MGGGARDAEAVAGCADEAAGARHGGHARAFVACGVSLSAALAQSAMASVPELERFLGEYVAAASERSETTLLHNDAVREAPEILARRLDLDAKEAADRAVQQRAEDQIAPLRLRPPLPIQQRAAVGEIAIPIAEGVTSAMKLVPIAGELVMAAEALTGRSLAGLGSEIARGERVVSAALALAPFAVEALAGGVRGAAQLLRASRALGRSTSDTTKALRAVRVIGPLSIQERVVNMMEWPEATHYKQRVSLTPAEISRAFAANELHLMAAVEAFISSTEPSTFESLLAQLSDTLRTEVTIYARDGVLHFDETIQMLEKAGDYTLGWVAYRDWAVRQAWLPEALIEAKAREARWQRWEAQRAQRRSLSEQGWILADLRVRIFRASTPEERAALEAEAKRLEAEFTAVNRGPLDA